MTTTRPTRDWQSIGEIAGRLARRMTASRCADCGAPKLNNVATYCPGCSDRRAGESRRRARLKAADRKRSARPRLSPTRKWRAGFLGQLGDLGLDGREARRMLADLPAGTWTRLTGPEAARAALRGEF